MEKGLIIETPPLDVYEQMAADEALCETLPAPYVLRFYNWKAPGITFGYSQRRKAVAEAYFGVTIDTDGAIHANAEAGPKYQVVIAGIDSDARPVIIVLRDATVTDRDDITLAGGSAIELSVTFTSHKPASGNQLDIYGLTVA